MFSYRMADGSVRRELRTPEEVFHKDSLASFSMVPLTRDHPDAGHVDSKTWKSHAVGVVGEEVKQDGDYVRATVLVNDEKAVADLEGGKRRQLSCGYTCDVVDGAGEWNGQPYDAVQKNIRGNHVALVALGRAGPDVRVHLDAADAEMVEDAGGNDGKGKDDITNAGGAGHKQGAPPMVKHRIDGYELDVSEQAKTALEKQDREHAAAVAKADEALKVTQQLAEKAKADGAELQKKLELAEKAKADAVDPVKLHAAVKARVALEQQAAAILGPKEKLDALDDKALKVKMLEKAIPGWSAEGKADAAIDGALEAVAAFRKKGAGAPGTSLEEARSIVAPTPYSGHADAELPDVGAAYSKMVERNRGAWKADQAQGNQQKQ